jgi:plastocyanin
VPQARADDANNISIQNISVQPYAVKVGDTFTVTATLVNNSTFPIFISDMISKDCQGPFFTVSFDNHVKVGVTEKDRITCSYVGLQERLDPGKKYTGTSPGLFFAYAATQSGTANVTVTFPYEIKNQTDPNQSNIDQTISKSFLFTIYDNDTITKSLNLGNHPIKKILSPLRQFQSGVATNDVICRPDMQLLIQNQENFPICVKLDSVSNLLHRNWSYPTNCEYVHGSFTAGVDGLIMIEKNASNQFSDKSYFPKNSTIVIGWNNTISWINQDDTPSSVTSDWNLFDSGPILPGAVWKHDFKCAGNYGYHSEPHPWMKGWIRVLPPG